MPMSALFGHHHPHSHPLPPYTLRYCALLLIKHQKSSLLFTMRAVLNGLEINSSVQCVGRPYSTSIDRVVFISDD